MPSPIDPQLKAHQEWLGYLQPVGLVVAPAAMVEAGWVLTQSGKELLARQERYREALEPLRPGELAAEVGAHGAAAAAAGPAGRSPQGGGDAAVHPEASGDLEDDQDDSAGLGFRSLTDLLVQHLGWREEQLDRRAETISGYRRELPELGTTLAPTAVVPAATGSGAQLLVVELPLGTDLDRKGSDGEPWRASAQERLERLLRETGVEAGLLFNGRQLRLVVAPKGESSGHLTFPLADLAAVGGRLMFAGLDQLLRASHVFDDPDGYRLTDVLKKSRSFQAVVSNALADQVLAALWELLRGFQQADALSRRTGDGEAQSALLGDLPEKDPQQLYGGLITVLMRLVFLLYAEDEALMPADAVYEQNYKVSGLFERLQQEAAELPDTMEQRYGAWSGLMSLCRLVFDGGGPTRDYLPARHGQLFDPAVYQWLETPWISDGVVLAVLRNLLIVKGERISYRALDVEQIGSVYEGIMGYAVRRIPGRCIGIKSKPQGARKQLTTAVDLDVLLAKSGPQRKAWLEQEANTALPATAAKALASASTEAEVLAALTPRLNRELFDGPQPAGSLVFQPTDERRRSGSHYTPRSLTRPIVEEALRPWLERCEHKPKAAQILELKICDPAMGSGAFLVESCRYLAELLEQAWTREGLPDALQPGGHAHGEEPLLYARRLIAQSCLYGVDKNPFAVNLARLSLWLVSLSKDAPFTFVDHALKCGDSLVGVTRQEIEAALKGASKQREIWEEKLRSLGQQQSELMHLFHADSRSDADDDRKRQALESLENDTAYLRTVGDLLVAAHFNGRNRNDRADKRAIYLAATTDCDLADELERKMREPLAALRGGEKGVLPLHWDLAFPDVFQRENPGFDSFVGNPPFLGGTRISEIAGMHYFDYLTNGYPGCKHHCDLVAYFFRRSFSLLRKFGTLGLVSTNTVGQGDTREGGLQRMLSRGRSVYSAEKRKSWPGLAAVIISTVHISKELPVSPVRLDGAIVKRISAYLTPGEIDESPKRLESNPYFSLGSKIYGLGFLFADGDEATTPLSVARRIMQENPEEAARIFPYLVGEEINQHPQQQPQRHVIYLSDVEEESELSRYGEIAEIVRTEVRPGRMLLGDNPNNKPLKKR